MSRCENREFDPNNKEQLFHEVILRSISQSRHGKLMLNVTCDFLTITNAEMIQPSQAIIIGSYGVVTMCFRFNPYYENTENTLTFNLRVSDCTIGNSKDRDMFGIDYDSKNDTIILNFKVLPQHMDNLRVSMYYVIDLERRIKALGELIYKKS